MDINPNSLGSIDRSQMAPMVRHDKNMELRKPLESPQDLVSLSGAQRTEEGKIPLIISAGPTGDMGKAKEAVSRSAVKDELPIINAVTAEMDEKSLKELLANKPEGISIYIDEKQKFIDDPIFEPAPRPRDDAGILTDIAVKTLGVDKIWDKGFTGKGVTIAVIDTGIYPHKDFGDRIIGFKDFVNGRTQPYDDQGHGTHVAGDAAGDGAMSSGKYKGTAPEASLVGIKSLDKNGAGKFSDIIKGIMWATENKEKYNIKVLNMSLGGPAFSSYKDDPICQAVEKAMDKGIMPVIAAGNSGPKAFTVGSPGSDPKVLTVGAFDDKGTVAKHDDEIAKFSSRGPTKVDNLTKPDLLSPGVNITAPTSYGSVLDSHPSVAHAGPDYITISGTSMATPVMAGIVADFIQARPDMKPDELKELFTSTARLLPKLDANQQGHGIVQPELAIDKALQVANQS